ncbi:MAG: hypothetical protein WBA43_24480 [Elainellaceae cyanobacterium]
MDPASEQISAPLAAAPVTQLAQRMPETDDDQWALVDSGRELPAYDRRERSLSITLLADGTN